MLSSEVPRQWLTNHIRVILMVIVRAAPGQHPSLMAMHKLSTSVAEGRSVALMQSNEAEVHVGNLVAEVEAALEVDKVAGRGKALRSPAAMESFMASTRLMLTAPSPHKSGKLCKMTVTVVSMTQKVGTMPDKEIALGVAALEGVDDKPVISTLVAPQALSMQTAMKLLMLCNPKLKPLTMLLATVNEEDVMAEALGAALAGAALGAGIGC